jgi:hypothetical protein
MGHPGAPDHDHHRSIWFAHDKVSGVNFWTDATPARIRQKQWLAYTDGDTEAIMAVRLGWADGHDPKDLLEQDLFAAVIPAPWGETCVELQATFRPTAHHLEFGQTNFGFLAVRMAKDLSAVFGTGVLTNDRGAVGEPAIFGQPAAWMDYSGTQYGVAEGVTLFDHPANPGFPAAWHVRDDGWMGPSACRTKAIVITRTEPLTLRYLLHAHRGKLDPARAAAILSDFSHRPGFELAAKPSRHTAFAARRLG